MDCDKDKKFTSDACESGTDPGGSIVADGPNSTTGCNETIGSTGFNGVGKIMAPNSSINAH